MLLEGHSIDDVITALLEMEVKATKGIMRGPNSWNWQNVERGSKKLTQHLPRKVVRPKKLLRGRAAYAAVTGGK